MNFSSHTLLLCGCFLGPGALHKDKVKPMYCTYFKNMIYKCISLIVSLTIYIYNIKIKLFRLYFISYLYILTITLLYHIFCVYDD